MAHNRGLIKAVSEQPSLTMSEEEHLELLADILLEIALEENQDEATS